jgi:hypothetical protein
MTMKKTFPAPADFNDPKEYVAIPMVPVESNQVACIGYDAGTKTLACQFTRGPGHIYHYPGVSPETHEAFMKAESIGKFFGQHIKPLPFKKFENLATDSTPAGAAA